MTAKARQVIRELKDSYISSRLAVADHLETVASNGPTYATNQSMIAECEGLIEGAQDVIATLKKGKK